MKTLFVYSTLTGNTKKACTWGYEAYEKEKEIVDIDAALHYNIENFDTIVLGFWVDKGSADAKTRKFLKQIEGKKIAYIGTLGAYPDSEHADKVRKKMQSLCVAKNEFLGGILVQGKVSDKLVETMSKFPMKLIRPMTPERAERIKIASLHPNEEDKQKIQEFIHSLNG